VHGRFIVRARLAFLVMFLFSFEHFEGRGWLATASPKKNVA